MPMPSFRCLHILLAVTLSLPVVASTSLEGAALDAALQGAWCNSDDYGKTCWGYDMFSRGSSTSCGRIPESKEEFLATSRYRVDGKRVCHELTSTNPNSLLKVGEQICADVIEVNSRIQRFKLVGDDKETVVYRIPPTQVRCPGAV
jgi:hypothetical protein